MPCTCQFRVLIDLDDGAVLEVGPLGEIVLVVFDAIGVRNVDIQNACKAGIRLMERGKTRV